MCNGGSWGNKGRGWVQAQIERQIEVGHAPDPTRRFILAMQFGGCNTPEALAIIRDRDCAHRGTGIELWDCDDLPDRWFRNAWRRSHNGGPLRLDMRTARGVQYKRIVRAYEEENRKREFELYSKALALDLPSYKDKVRRAEDDNDLRRIWPEELQ